jgi:hypothetical protein
VVCRAAQALSWAAQSQWPAWAAVPARNDHAGCWRQLLQPAQKEHADRHLTSLNFSATTVTWTSGMACLMRSALVRPTTPAPSTQTWPDGDVAAPTAVAAGAAARQWFRGCCGNNTLDIELRARQDGCWARQGTVLQVWSATLACPGLNGPMTGAIGRALVQCSNKRTMADPCSFKKCPAGAAHTAASPRHRMHGTTVLLARHPGVRDHAF